MNKGDNELLSRRYENFNPRVFGFCDLHRIERLAKSTPSDSFKMWNFFDLFSTEIEEINVPLPILTAYPLDNLKSKLSVQYSSNPDTFRTLAKLKKFNGPEFLEDYWNFTNFKKRSFSKNKYGSFSIQSNFDSDLSILEKQINDGTRLFGKDLYLVGYADWKNLRHESKDYSVVGRNGKNFYLLGTTSKNKELVNGHFGIDFSMKGKFIVPQL